MNTTDTRPVADLFAALTRPTIYVWNESFEPPAPGETYYLSAFTTASDRATYGAPRYLQVPATLWGDYVGSLCDRSNEAALCADYPDTFIRLEGAYSSTVLVLPMDASIDQYLFDALLKLADEYPLYDEQHYSDLEQDLISECWDDYGARDFADLIGDDESDNDALYAKYAAMCEEKGQYPQAESAISVSFHFRTIVGSE